MSFRKSSLLLIIIKSIQWKCEAILTFEGFCVHSAEGCHSKGHREIAQNGTSSISTDSSLDTYKAESNYNNNYQLQSFESK